MARVQAYGLEILAWVRWWLVEPLYNIAALFREGSDDEGSASTVR